MALPRCSALYDGPPDTHPGLTIPPASLMIGADYAENVASAQCGILLRDTPAHIQATLI